MHVSAIESQTKFKQNTPFPMESNFVSFVVVLLILNLIALTSSKPFSSFSTDEDALLAFKNTITSDPYGVLSNNWSTHTSICHWIGVSCGTKHYRVMALNVSGFDLGGTIPPHLGNLTFLRSLDISFNHFKGFIPSQLSNLRRLKEINMGVNSITGKIPSWFGALSQLQHIHLNNNNFSGRIPFCLFNISNLQTLVIGPNSLEGNIPQEISNYSSLEILNLEGNRFTGSMPNGILNMSSLIEINLRNNSLSGKLPNDICDNTTPKLKRIYLARNQHYGEIPTNIYKCRELEELRLGMNYLSGHIPSEIGSLSMLKILALWSNNFTGDIPKEIGYLTSLKTLFIYQNRLTGILPRQVGNLTSLNFLYLHSNYLSGELPQEIGNLPFLEDFSVANNSLFGAIPYSIFNISTLKFLELSFNEFSGSLPSNMGISLFNLEDILLHVNNLSGPIPSSITNCSKLWRLSMGANSFSGFIPNFGNLRLLQRLKIYQNNLSGEDSPTQELVFLSSLTNCRYLKILGISENPLNGILPTSIGNLSTSLQIMNANRCNIKGVIPSEIGNLSSLLYVYLNGNQITGSIPSTVGKMKQLQKLYLGGNRLQGYIPNELCKMSNLGELRLGGNMLSGPIPECLGEVKSLRVIYLVSNKLNSTIPSNFWNLSDLIDLDFSSNYLGGQLSSQIGNLKVINWIDLSSNQFFGEIPSLIDGCQSLEFLNLANNKFTGSIPQSLGNVKGLIRLDLSRNNLSGLIPKPLENLHFLEFFNASYNTLEGRIPNRGPFLNFTAQSFLHNFALCGATKFQVPPCIEGSRSRSGVLLMKYIVPPVVSAIILVIIIVVLIRSRKQIQIPSSTHISLGVEWRRISYIELVQGTSSFSESNLLGRGSFGSVFRGTLSDGLNIGVKVFNLQLEGVGKSFDTEAKILSTIRHRNLVQIIGCCTNTEFKALILAYMPNGSLEKWLYSNIYYLDLVQRLEIAIDVASALEYLHHGHNFIVVHCDIKPSNVLLDEDMTARLSDFGIAKLFDQGETVIQTRTMATIGYAAPEYGSEGKVSTNGDVYSFGIMLLEMFTRKKPTDDMFSGELSLKEWVSAALQENAIIEVVDPSLLSREDRDFIAKMQCVSSIFDLAMKCLGISPNERINMIEVAATLLKIRSSILSGTRRH